MRRNLIVFIILGILIFGILLIWSLNKTETPQRETEISIKEGKYYVKLGSEETGAIKAKKCTKEIILFNVGGLNIETFYDSRENIIGNCTTYEGPGASGGWKGGCSSNELLKEPCIGSGCGALEGIRLPKYHCEI